MHELIALRHELHRHPELSSLEKGTAARIEAFMSRLRPDDAVHGLGGHGAAYVFGDRPGPTLLLRCELDALPIETADGRAYRSESPGVSHQCGHDGHMTILAAVAAGLADRRPRRGRVVLLFQPAEETGEGAVRVLADERFPRLAPDLVFALHNLPGEPLGRVIVRHGAFNCASVGLVAELRGRSSHAADPQAARSPAPALARLLTDLPSLAGSRAADGALLTLTHARLGRPSLGITPGDGELMATLRARSDRDLEELCRAVEASIRSAAEDCGVELALSRREPFRALVNDPRACQAVERAARAAGLDLVQAARPFPWSEDFSELTHRFPGALFGLGAGEACAPLHSPAYNFPDSLIPVGADLFSRLIDDLLRT